MVVRDIQPFVYSSARGGALAATNSAKPSGQNVDAGYMQCMKQTFVMQSHLPLIFPLYVCTYTRLT